MVARCIVICGTLWNALKCCKCQTQGRVQIENLNIFFIKIRHSLYTCLAKLPLTGDKMVVALPGKEQGEEVNWLVYGHCGGSHQALVRVFSFSGSKKVNEYSLIQVAYGHSAISTFSPIGSWPWNGMRVCVDRMNLKYALCWHIHISVHFMLCQCYTQAHVHMHPQTIWAQWTDGAKSGYCWTLPLQGLQLYVFNALTVLCIWKII